MLIGTSEYEHRQHQHQHQQQEMAQWARNPMAMDRRWKANIEVAPNCPRCASTNTKFCYYNNYSLSQPRYFCKGCRRYWTKGGSLRNVPVGGGCRKSRRAKPSSSSKTSISSSSSSTSYSPSTSTSGDDKSSSSDIDLAAVFAKYLNHNSTSAAADNEDAYDDVDNCTMELQTPADVVGNDDQDSTQLQYSSVEGVPPELISPADDVGSAFDDVLWSDVSNFTACWQLPIDEFQPENDQLLLSDNWSCFDLPPHNEIFSRPSQQL